MTDWTEGMPCRVVEQDRAAGEPLEGGRVLPAKVTGVNGPHVFAVAENGGSLGRIGPLCFDAETGWHGTFRWRLVAGADEEGGTASEGEAAP